MSPSVPPALDIYDPKVSPQLFLRRSQKAILSKIVFFFAERPLLMKNKYSNLSDHYHFVPGGIETLRPSRHQASQADQQKKSGR